MLSTRMNSLNEKRNGLIEDMKALTLAAAKENRSMTDEENVKWDKMDKDQEAVTAEIRRLKRQHELESETADVLESTPADKRTEDQKHTDAITDYAKRGKSGMKAENKLLLEKRAAVQGTTVGDGGYTIPTLMAAEIEKALLAYGGMMEAGRIIKTSGGNPITYPYVNDTSNRGYLLAEAGDSETSATKITFATPLTLNAYKYTSGTIRADVELLEDSAFDLTTFIKDCMIERIWRALNLAFTTGDGTNKPEGFTIGGTASGIASFSAASGPTYANLVDTLHSVDPLYREKGIWMFHDAMLARIRKMVDSHGDPLWAAGDISRGIPDMILGKPFIINQDMASPALNAKSLAFGDFKKYIIRIVNDIRFKRLDEIFAATDQVGFTMFIRADGHVLDAGTHPIKYSVQSTT